MRLYLVQHGIATSKEENSARPLTSQGREDTVRTAGFLSLFERPKPTCMFHSNTLRSQQTAHMIAEAWHCKNLQENMDLSPQSSPNIWAKHLSDMNEDTLLVGHLPHLQGLAGILLCQDEKRHILHHKNSGISCLERHEHQWSLCWQVHPQLFYPQD